jgi:hypothetical protein
MRTVHFLALSAALALGASVMAVNGAHAQGLVHMSPPEASSAQVGKPKFEDVKLQTGTALPPKSGSAMSGSAIFFNPIRNNASPSMFDGLSRAAPHAGVR